MIIETVETEVIVNDVYDNETHLLMAIEDMKENCLISFYGNAVIKFAAYGIKYVAKRNGGKNGEWIVKKGN